MLILKRERRLVQELAASAAVRSDRGRGERQRDIGNTVRDALETYRSTGLLTDGKHGAPRTDQGPHRIRGGIARRSRWFTAFPLAHARFIRRKIW